MSLAVVLGLGLTMLLITISGYRRASQTVEVQKRNQIRIDYSQREQAMLRAVLREVPNKAMRAMMGDSAQVTSWQNEMRWRWIFEEAFYASQGEQALDSTVAQTLGIASNQISANTGDGSHGHIRNVVGPVGGFLTNTFYIDPGINGRELQLGSAYPESLLWTDSSAYSEDRDKIIITNEKTYSDGSKFKKLPFPQIHFGYGSQGGTFIAKRNWWAFSVSYGRTSEDTTGVPAVKKDYILSIYETPAQLGLGSTTTTNFGQHADGSDWANVTIQGGVFAERALTSGTLALDRLSSRRGIALGTQTAVAGLTPDQNGVLPSREVYEAANSSFFPISNSSDSGLVAFIPIDRGSDAFTLGTAGADDNRISPTGWDWYSRPAERCNVKVILGLTLLGVNNVGFELRLEYKDTLGVTVTESLSADSLGNLLTDAALQAVFGGDVVAGQLGEGSGTSVEFPLLFESPYGLDNALSVNLQDLATFLTHIGADITDTNNALHIDSRIEEDLDGLLGLGIPLVLPTLPDEIPVIVRGSDDITQFPKGLSIVTPSTVYIADDLNITQAGVDALGLPVFPPFSLYTPDVRFGIRPNGMDIDFTGRINQVSTESGSVARPLDLKSGPDNQINPDRISANLSAIDEPEELPPVYSLSWLVVIEEVH